MEIVLGRDVEEPEDLIEHLAMLGGCAHVDSELAVTPHLPDERGQLDGLGARAEDHEDFVATFRGGA
jgi:hypothetical protein